MSDDNYSNYDDEAPDPFPDDPGYKAFRLKVAQLENRARRTFSRSSRIETNLAKAERTQYPHYSRHRWGGGIHRRIPRVHNVARRITRACSSGVANESSGDGDGPEPPPALRQLLPGCRHKNPRELSSPLIQIGPVNASRAVSP